MGSQATQSGHSVQSSAFVSPKRVTVWPFDKVSWVFAEQE